MPRGQRAALEKALAARGAAVHTQRLRARYFDTASCALAEAAIALRLRRENRRWVQTLKAAGATPLTRVELESVRPDDQLDLAAFDGTDAGQRLAKALGGELPAVRFETDVRRKTRQLRAGSSRIEAALDVGQVIAQDRRAPLSEIEFELQAGDPQALLALAARWRARFGLCIDPRSKAEQGDLLARGLRFAPPRKARRIQYAKSADAREALHAIVLECHAHLVENLAPLAIGEESSGARPGQPPSPATDEYVHQARVALRRLRSAMRLFDGWGVVLPADIEQGARAVFGRFGANRDFDVIASDIAPALARAGAPPLPLHRSAGALDPVGQLARHAGAQDLVLGLLRWSIELSSRPPPSPPVDDGASRQGSSVPDLPGSSDPATQSPPNVDLPPAVDAGTEPPPPARKPRPFARLAQRRLAKWHAAISAAGETFLTLDDDTRHRLRKRVKRQRYAVEFLAPLLKPRRVSRYLRELAAVQEVLGELNDLVVARDMYREISEADPRALFALGWIAARLDVLSTAARDALRRLADESPV